MSAPERIAIAEQLADVTRELGYKLATLKTSIDHSIDKGYDFGTPNANLYLQIVQLESARRELNFVLYGVFIK